MDNFIDRKIELAILCNLHEVYQMRKLADMSNLELGNFVGANAPCKDAPPGVFTRGQDHEKMSREDRIDYAAPLCGACVIRAACLEQGARLSFQAARGTIYGGVLFGGMPFDIVAGKEVSYPKRRKK